MIVSEVRYERVNGELRFDAEYYQPRFLEIEKALKQSRCVSLREIIKFSKLRRDPRNNPDKEFRYIDISNINIFTGEISSQKLKGHQAPSRARKVVKEKEIVLSTVRPNRNAVAIIPRELDGEICSTGFAVIKAEKINPYFLFVFLKTKYAIDQLVRQAMASMYPAVSEEDIGSVLVPLPPIPFQEKIESLIKEVHKKRDKANKKYEETERLLNKTLGIENLKLRRNKIFETRFSEVGIENRFDAEYYEPRFTEISKILKTSRYDCKRLRDLGRLVNLRVNPSERPTNKFTYVEIGDVDISTGEIEIKTVLGYEAPPNARKLLKKGDLIISMVRPTRGAITIIPEELDNSVGSTAFYVLKAESPLKESLFVYLRSFLGLSQLGRAVVGAMYPTLKENYIDNILVPIIPEERQKRISSLVIESFNLRKDAKELLDRARREVEGFIENKNLWRRGRIQTNYKGTVPLLLTEKVKFIKFPVRIKYKEYSMFNGSKMRLVQQIGDGSIIKRFEKTLIPQKKTDVVCPHFLELKWATGCPYDCSWCYLKGTFRFLPYKTKPHIKDFDKIEKHTRTFLEYVRTPEILNTGEIADSLMLEGNKKSFVKFIVPLFESQNRHKVLLVTKSDKIKNLLKIDSHHQVIVSFSLNAIPVAQKWEKKAPSVEERMKAAKVLYKEGYEVRIRIDPMIPVENWEKLYTHLVDLIFDSFIPERITLGSLRGLQSTINGTSDKSWVKYLSEYSNWGKKIDINLRLAMYRKIISYLKKRYKYHRIALCKETLAIWEILELDYEKIKCNCV